MTKERNNSIDEIVVVLLSGGIDSTTAATMMSEDPLKEVYFLTKKTDLPEFDQAMKIGEILKERYSNVVGHYILEIGLENAIQAGKTGSEIGARDFNRMGVDLLKTSMGRMGDRAFQENGIPAGYPGFRDELFVLAGLDLCEKMILNYLRENPSRKLAGKVVIGTTGEDMQNFNDIKPEIYGNYINSIAALKEGPRLTGKPLQSYLPFANMSKADVIKLGMKIDAPLELTWSCYSIGPDPCNLVILKPQNDSDWCQQCHWREDAFRKAGIPDPAVKQYSAKSRDHLFPIQKSHY